MDECDTIRLGESFKCRERAGAQTEGHQAVGILGTLGKTEEGNTGVVGEKAQHVTQQCLGKIVFPGWGSTKAGGFRLVLRRVLQGKLLSELGSSIPRRCSRANDAGAQNDCKQAVETFHKSKWSKLDDFCGCGNLTVINKMINNKNHKNNNS